jgi:hypothetical protein
MFMARNLLTALLFSTALLSPATAPAAGARDDVKLKNVRENFLQIDTYLVNTGARKLVAHVHLARFHDGKKILEGVGAYLLNPGEEISLGKELNGPVVTVFSITGAEYSSPVSLKRP